MLRQIGLQLELVPPDWAIGSYQATITTNTFVIEIRVAVVFYPEG